MNAKRVGRSFWDDAKRWEKDPAFRRGVELHVEKTRLAMLLRRLREREGLTQAQLAKRAGVPQPAIARIEGNGSATLPRLDVFNRIVHAAGYRTTVSVRKGRTVLAAAL
jgi:DNA-binding XRE family transcriptional regulator